MCLTSEGVVFPCRDRLLAQYRVAVAVEHTDTGAVGIPLTLRCQAVRRIQQPECGRRDEAACVQAEQAAHAADATVTVHVMSANGRRSLRQLFALLLKRTR